MNTLMNRTGSGRTYTNVLLTAIVALMGGMWLGQVAGPGAGVAQAQPVSIVGGTPEDPNHGGLISASEQRKHLIAEMRTIATRLDRIEAALSRGINVKVTDMPPVQVQDKK